jgi:hypothetical protein
MRSAQGGVTPFLEPIDTGPPENSSGRLWLNRLRTKDSNDATLIANHSDSINRYSRLLWQRRRDCLLQPFQCSRCGVINLDPIGCAGKRLWLCEICAEGDTP